MSVVALSFFAVVGGHLCLPGASLLPLGVFECVGLKNIVGRNVPPTRTQLVYLKIINSTVCHLIQFVAVYHWLYNFNGPVQP